MQNENVVFEKVIDEVRSITAEQVAKKQDAAKLNYPNIIAKIKAQAKLGCSMCTLASTEMNEYVKILLERDGFKVSLCDEPKSYDYKSQLMQRDLELKRWEIRW